MFTCNFKCFLFLNVDNEDELNRLMTTPAKRLSFLPYSLLESAQSSSEEEIVDGPTLTECEVPPQGRPQRTAEEMVRK